jgi:protein-tyrosine phosphatase
MAPPEDVTKFHQEVILVIDEVVSEGKKVIAHCRGGIGRAGLVAACYLVFKLKLKPDDAIHSVRSRRDKRCVESRKQVDFIVKYS